MLFTLFGHGMVDALAGPKGGRYPLYKLKNSGFVTSWRGFRRYFVSLRLLLRPILKSGNRRRTRSIATHGTEQSESSACARAESAPELCCGNSNNSNDSSPALFVPALPFTLKDYLAIVDGCVSGPPQEPELL